MTHMPRLPRRVFALAVKHRIMQAGLVFLLLCLQIADAFLFVAFIVAVPLIFLMVGVPAAIGTVRATRAVCNAERWLFRRGFWVNIDSPYRPFPRGYVGRQLLELSRDKTVWRDFAWQAVNMTLGVLVTVAYLILLGGGLVALLQPILYLCWPQTFNNFYGYLTFQTHAQAWAFAISIATGHFVLWWTCGNLIVNSYAKLAAIMLRSSRSASLEQRVEELTTSRADTVDSSAAELRRIERNLHDGAQARIVAIGMSLGMAEQLLYTDRDAAGTLLAEARTNAAAALTELRDLVRGIHPPLLSDRGLVSAVEALTRKHVPPVTVHSDLPGRPPKPVESAAYFGIAEALTNVVKYAEAKTVVVRIGYFRDRVGITVRDDGIGGATLASGGGLEGLVKRLAAFDGRVSLRSPEGGPTVVALEIPCSIEPEDED